MICSWMYANNKVLLYKTSLATNLLLVFVREEVLMAVEKVDARFSKATLNGLTGHKGSISIRTKLKVSFSFIN